MKDLYICIFRKFHLSLQEINQFDYSKQGEALTNKMQKAFSYYKTQSRDGKIMFMQFCRNLQRVGDEHNTMIIKQKLVAESRPATKSYVFVNLYNLNLMLIHNNQKNLFSFICIQSNNDSVALNEYSALINSTYNIDIEKGRCNFSGSCQMLTAPEVISEYAVVFYPLTLGEFKILETSRNDTIFKNVNDPVLALSNHYICVSPFMSAINGYINKAKNIMTRRKAESAPVKPVNMPSKPLSDDEKDELAERLKQFEKSLDGILEKYNLLK